MMEKKQSKSSKQANEIVSKETIDQFNILLDDILKAWTLIVLQDIDSLKKLCEKANDIHSNISKNHNKNIICAFKSLVECTKAAIHIAEGLHSNLNDIYNISRYYKDARERYDVALGKFQQVKKATEPKFISSFSQSSKFNFLIEFYGLITQILKEDSQNVLAKSKKYGYVNQVERFTYLAGMFRKIFDIHIRLDNEDDKLKKSMEDMRTFIGRIIDDCKTKAGKIEDKYKQIAPLPPISNKVFIVHGHDKKIKDELIKILNCFGVENIVLYERPNKGETIIEKFEREAKSSRLVFVIMTSDDEVKVKKDGKTYAQARPNVFFELGWFCGKYGRERVRIIKQNKAKMPSDLDGILIHKFSGSLKKIKSYIEKDLKERGIIGKGGIV